MYIYIYIYVLNYIDYTYIYIYICVTFEESVPDVGNLFVLRKFMAIRQSLPTSMKNHPRRKPWSTSGSMRWGKVFNIIACDYYLGSHCTDCTQVVVRENNGNHLGCRSTEFGCTLFNGHPRNPKGLGENG